MAFAQDATSKVNATIERLEREIELLREYRARLVADVVTGRLDVIEAAAQLPDEPTSDKADEPMNDADEIELADEQEAA